MKQTGDASERGGDEVIVEHRQPCAASVVLQVPTSADEPKGVVVVPHLRWNVQMNPNWHSLVAEAQFATELTLTGLRRLSEVPARPAANSDGSYALHVGLYSYASGLERMCKLAIACHGYVTNRKFPELRSYSHKIGRLLDALEALDISSFKTHSNLFVRPVDDLDPDLTNSVERFASGSGRYEYLDSLSAPDALVNTFNEWSSLCERSRTVDEVLQLVRLGEAVRQAMREDLAEHDLVASTSPIRDYLERQIHEPSVGVVLGLFRKVRWAAAIVNVTTNYTAERLPILGEVVGPAFLHSSTDFFKFHIAQIGDEEMMIDELQDRLQRTRDRDEDEGGQFEDIWLP